MEKDFIVMSQKFFLHKDLRIGCVLWGNEKQKRQAHKKNEVKEKEDNFRREWV